MATETYSGLTNEQRNFYDLVLLEYAKKNLPHAAFGQQARAIQIPVRQGMTVEFRRFTPLSPATTPLTEGTTPAGSNLTVSKVTATVSQYGDFVPYSELLSRVGIDPIVTEISQLLGYQAGLTFDILARNELVANATAQYASTATSTDTITSGMIITAEEIMEALATLESNDARPFDTGNFVGILHPKTKYDLLSDDTVMNTFLHATETGKENPLYTHKWGTWMGVDWYVTSNAYHATNAGSVEVYTTLIIGKNAYGVGGLAGDIPSNFGSLKSDPNTGETIMPVSLKTHEPTPSASDPLGQRGSVGWISTFVAKVLNPDWVVGIQHAVSL